MLPKGDIVIRVLGNGSVRLKIPSGMDQMEVQAYLLDAAMAMNSAVQKTAKPVIVPGGSG